MDANEARSRTEAIRSSIDVIRVHLYEVYTREGWRSLGYDSWGAYLSEEFPDSSTAQLRRQTHAALMEASMGEEVGAIPEGYIRAIREVLHDDGHRTLAYYATIDRHEEPTVRDFRRVACEIYVVQEGEHRIRERMLDGDISPVVAYSLCKQVEKFNKQGDYDLLVVSREVSDLELIPIMKRLKESRSATWEEILHSETIPAFPEPIPLSRATSYNLLAWLEVASAEHRAQWGANNRAKRDERRVAVEALVQAVRSFFVAKNKGSFTLAVQRLRDALQRYEETNEPAQERVNGDATNVQQTQGRYDLHRS